MTPDPMEDLRQIDRADRTLAPTFTAELRARIERELGPVPPGGAMSTTRPPTSTIAPRHVPAGCTPSRRTSPSATPAPPSRWYQDIFGATMVSDPIVMPDGRIGHVELRIGDAVFMMADEFAEIDVLGPTSRGGTTVSFVINVPDVDTVYARAVDAGATAERPVADQFYGVRAGWLSDPWGHRWSISTPLAAVPGRLAERDLGTDGSSRSSTSATGPSTPTEPRPTRSSTSATSASACADVDRAARLLRRPLRLAAAAGLAWTRVATSRTSRRPAASTAARTALDHPLLPGARHPGGGGRGCEPSAATPASRSSWRRDGTRRATTTRASPSTSGSRPRATERAVLIDGAPGPRQLITGTSRYSRSMS